nr:MAG: replication associated protein [Microviridae sp.]
MITQSQYLVKFSAKKMFIFTFLNAATVNQTLKSIVLQVMKHLLNTIITNIFHPVRMRFIKFFVIITRRTHLFAVDNNIIIGIAFFAMIFEPFSTYAGTFIVKKQTGKDAPSHYKGRIPEFMVASNRPGIGAKWLEDHGEECYANDYVGIITVCTEPKNFVIKINIKQNVMIMGTNMKFTIFTTAEKANTAAILTAKKFHQTFMKNLRREYGSGIRFLGCGEYGELHVRPHYHYILFNIDFDDKIFRFRTDGYNTYTSSRFAKVWKYGMHLIGEFSFDSAAYAGTIGSNHEFRNATFIVRRSVFTCLLFNYITSDIGSRIKTKLANKMHTVFPYLGKTRRSVSIITVCTEPKNFVIKINIKQNVMIMVNFMFVPIIITFCLILILMTKCNDNGDEHEVHHIHHSRESEYRCHTHGEDFS